MTTATTKTGTSLEHHIGPRGRFTLRQASGEITIRGVEGGTARVRSDDDRPLGDTFTIETTDDALVLREIERLGFGRGRSGSAELTIEIPHGASVDVEAASADIEASDLSGEKRLRTASGEVTLTRLAGPVDIETVSGEIELDGQAPLDLTVKSVSGDVRVRVPSLRRLDLGTTSGDIRLDAELTGDGPYALRTISGDVTVVGRGGFRVEAESITGDLSSELPSKRESQPGRKVLIVGRPGPTLRFRSVSGDFHVAAPRDPAVRSDEATAPDAPLALPAGKDGHEGHEGDEDARLEILRALERGDIDVAEATTRLSQLDEVLR